MSIHELQAALRALDEANKSGTQRQIYETLAVAIEAARRVAETTGEPVAAVGYGSEPAWLDSWLNSPKYRELPRGTKLYTTPPSADALVEALGKLSETWRSNADDALRRSGTWSGYDMVERTTRMADALDAALAEHKENTDGR